MKRDWTSRTALVLIGLILIALNLAGLNLFARADLTDDQVYSLSDASIKLVENLEDPVTLTAFFSDGLPAPYSANRRFLKDKLDDYRAYGGQKVQYKFVDPTSDEQLREEAGRYGIPPVQIQVIESDNVQFKNAYMGLAIQYGGEREVIPVVQDLSTLEYDITSAIRRLTQEKLPTVGFLTGHGEPSPVQQMQTLSQELRRNYDVRLVSVEDSVLTPRPDALLVVAPSDSLPEAHLRALDRYLMSGGRAGFLVNRVSANLQMGQAALHEVGLDRLLDAYGARIAPNLVMDEQSSALTVQRQAGLFNLAQQIRYPFLPLATRFNPDHMMVSRLSDVMFYFASAIDTTGGVPEGVEVEPLIYSSQRSTTQEGFFMIQPMMERGPMTDGPFLLAAAYRGTFPSAFTAEARSTPTRLAVVGDGDVLNESVVGRVPGNIELGLNMVDWLLQDDALLAIRSKKVAPRALEPVPESIRPWIKYGNMLLPVGATLLFGLARWRRRKARRVVLTA